MFTFVLAVLACLATLFAACDACNNVPSMTWDDACVKSCSRQDNWYKLCQDTLRNAPPTAELTEFALIATRLAKLKYEDTMQELDQMLGDGDLPVNERTVIDQCKVKYGDARSLMASVADQLFACDFSRPRQEYIDAQVSVWSCQNGLSSYQGLPLYAMVTADYDLTMVAYELGALIVGR